MAILLMPGAYHRAKAGNPDSLVLFGIFFGCNVRHQFEKAIGRRTDDGARQENEQVMRRIRCLVRKESPRCAKPRRPEKAREFVLSREDEDCYLNALPASMRLLAVFLIETGLRVGEALSLEWPQVNLREKPGYVTVRASHAKNGKARTIPFTPRARRATEAIAGPHGLVFRNRDGEPLYLTWLDQQHATVRTLLGFSQEFVLHSLRHAFGIRLGTSGADIRTIIDLMGHASMAVAQKYVHPSTEANASAL